MHDIPQLVSYSSNLIELKGGKSISKEDIELVKGTSASMFAGTSHLFNLVEVGYLLHAKSAGSRINNCERALHYLEQNNLT